MMDERIEAQELYCHNCDGYVQFRLDVSINGRHVLNCPNCGHEHCRVVVDGQITEERWDSRNAPTVYITTATYSSTSTFDSYTLTSGTSASTNVFMWQSWSSSSGGTA